MDRRHFLRGSVLAGTGAAFAAASPLKALARDAAVAGGYRVGQRYRSACGRELRLEAIDQQRLSRRSNSYRLCFRGEACAALGEGTHVLMSGPNGEVTLFLQASADGGLVAWFNHLA